MQPRSLSRASASCFGCWLSRVLLTLLILLVGGEARAAVPMCSEDGRTIAAPPIGTPTRDLVLEAGPLPCRGATATSPSRPAEPDRSSTPSESPLLRAMPAPRWALQRPGGTPARLVELLPVFDSGFRNSIERPPRH
jgi:hypothetical protein